LKAKSLLSVLDKLNETAVADLSGLGSVTSSDVLQAQQEYRSANALAQQAVDYWKRSDFGSAVSVALESMKGYEEVLRLTSGSIPNASSESVVATEKVIAIKSSIERTYEYLARIESLAGQARDSGFDVAGLEALVSEAKLCLENATAIMYSDPQGANQLLSSTGVLIDRIVAMQNSLSDQMQVARAEQYVANAEQRVEILLQNLTSATTLVPTATQSTSISVLNQAQSNLAAAKNYLNEGKLNETIVALASFRSQEVASIKILQDAGVAVPPQLSTSANATNTAVTVRPTSTPSLGSSSNSTSSSSSVTNTTPASTPGSTPKIPVTSANITSSNVRSVP
jgi:hypothetical protein